jgi:FkbM family methyltransferase
MAMEKVGRGPDTLTFVARSGLSIACPNVPGARVPIYEIFAEDCYHFDWFLGPLAGRPLQVLDVGGQVGTFSCRLAQLQPAATISTYEPSPTTAGFLRQNIERNHFGDRITVVQAALAASVGTAEFDDNGAGSGENSLVTGARGTTATVTVETTTFDAAVAAAAAPLDLVKIDCEGGEYDLVAASSPESWASVQRLVIEYHPVPGHSWDELRTWFEGVGLSVQHEESGGGVGVVWLSRDPLPALTA